MTDMSLTIAPKSDQLNADDLISGPRTIEVTKVALSGSAEQPVSIGFKGDNGKPFKPCKSMRRVMVRVWGTDGNAYVGKRMTIYRDDGVTWGGQAVGGIRISHMSGISQPVTMALTATQKQRKPYTVKPLADATVADTGLAELRDRARPLYAELKEAAARGVARDFVLRPDVDDLLQELAERDAKTYAAFQKLIPAALEAAEESGRVQAPEPVNAPTEPTVSAPQGEREGTDSAATPAEPPPEWLKIAREVRKMSADAFGAWQAEILPGLRAHCHGKSLPPVLIAALNDRKQEIAANG